MNTNRPFLLPLVTAAAMVVLPTATPAQTPPAQQKPAAAAPAQAKPQQVQPQPVTTPAQAKPQPTAAKPAAKPDTPAPAANAKPSNAQPTLLGQYDNWGAYWAAPGGHKVCFAVARPNGGQSNAANRPHNPTYLFVTSRPMDKVKDEVSIIVGAPFKSNSDATAAIGATNFAMVTQADGAWIKNTPDENRMIEAMRKGTDLVLKGMTERGAQSADTFSLRGLVQALDRVARECK
jgi:hypothetical protein